MNVLAIGAHFDDIELGCGGALAKHVRNSDHVVALVITHSKYTNHDGQLIREKETALAEGEAATRILGIHKLICNNYETKQLTCNHILVEAINSVIDRHHIDFVYTHWDFDVHQDHQAVGKATLAAGRKVHSMLMYRSNLYISSVEFRGNFFVDISDFIDIKMRAIEAHRTENRKFGPNWLDFWRNEASNNGQRIGVHYAEVFQLVKHLS